MFNSLKQLNCPTFPFLLHFSSPSSKSKHSLGEIVTKKEMQNLGLLLVRAIECKIENLKHFCVAPYSLRLLLLFYLKNHIKIFDTISVNKPKPI